MSLGRRTYPPSHVRYTPVSSLSFPCSSYHFQTTFPYRPRQPVLIMLIVWSNWTIWLLGPFEQYDYRFKYQNVQNKLPRLTLITCHNLNCKRRITFLPFGSIDIASQTITLFYVDNIDRSSTTWQVILPVPVHIILQLFSCWWITNLIVHNTVHLIDRFSEEIVMLLVRNNRIACRISTCLIFIAPTWSPFCLLTCNDSFDYPPIFEEKRDKVIDLLQWHTNQRSEFPIPIMRWQIICPFSHRWLEKFILPIWLAYITKYILVCIRRAFFPSTNSLVHLRPTIS